MATCRSCQTDTGFFGTSLCELCATRIKGPLGAWAQQLELVLADRFLSPQEEADLRAYQLHLGLSDAHIAPLMPKLMRAKALSIALTGHPPAIAVPNFLPPHGEVAHYAFPASHRTTTSVEHYVPGYRGNRCGSREASRSEHLELAGDG